MWDLLFGRSPKSESKPKSAPMETPTEYVGMAGEILRQKLSQQKQTMQTTASTPLASGRVRIGVATGRLASRGHTSVPPAGTPIDLDYDTLFGGSLFVGPMGSGKTRAGLQPFCRDFLSGSDAGLFAYGVKPNWSSAIVRIAQSVGMPPDEIHVLGPDHAPWPILAGLPPEAVATFVSEAFRLNNARSGDQFFTSAAANAVRRAAQIVYAACASGIDAPLTVEQPIEGGTRTVDLSYDLQSIAKIIHGVQSSLWRAMEEPVSLRCDELRAAGFLEAADTLSDACLGLDSLLVGKPNETVGSVIMQCDTVIEPFISSAALRRAFCGDPSATVPVGDLLDRGHVVVLDVDLGAHGAAARLVYLLAFEQLRVWMLRRIERGSCNPVAFVADEYAEVALKTHRTMWRLCREASIAPAVAYQLQSDLAATVGSRDDADALVAGFSTKVLYRTDDDLSVQMIARALGRAEVERESTTTQRSSSTNATASFGQSGGSSATGASETSSRSRQQVERSVVDPQLVQSLTSSIRRDIPVSQQKAETIVVTTLHQHRIADIVTISAWDPPAMSAEGGN